MPARCQGSALYTNLETALAAKGSQSQAAKDFIALISVREQSLLGEGWF